MPSFKQNRLLLRDLSFAQTGDTVAFLMIPPVDNRKIVIKIPISVRKVHIYSDFTEFRIYF